MTNNKTIVSEVMKSTLITLALFTLFDIAVQGYNNYHNWIISFYIVLFIFCFFISKRYL